MDPKHMKEAQALSRDAFRQTTERFLAGKRVRCTCLAGNPPLSKGPHLTTCPAHVAKETP